MIVVNVRAWLVLLCVMWQERWLYIRLPQRWNQGAEVGLLNGRFIAGLTVRLLLLPFRLRRLPLFLLPFFVFVLFVFLSSPFLLLLFFYSLFLVLFLRAFNFFPQGFMFCCALTLFACVTDAICCCCWCCFVFVVFARHIIVGLLFK